LNRKDLERPVFLRRRGVAALAANEEQAVWLPVPEGSVLVPVAEAMRRARRVADKHKDSKFVDRLFRPRS
jgi:hypothetical protein